MLWSLLRVTIFNENKFDFEITSHSNTQLTGEVVTLAYTNKELLKQRYATAARNVEQVFWQFDGDMDLYPNYDNFYEVKKSPVPEHNIDIDLAGPTLGLIDELNKIQAIQEPQLDVISESVSSQVIDSKTTSSSSGNSTTTTQTDTIETTKSILANESRALFKGDSSATKVNVGEYVRDATFSPYIREQNVHFHAYGLRPNVRHYVYFDEQAVSDKTRPAIVPDGLTVSRDNFHPNGTVGANLVSDSAGNLFGIIQIPEETFFVGERMILVADVDTYTDADELAVSIAETQFNAYNYGVDKQTLTVATKSVIPRMERVSRTTTRIEHTITQRRRNRRITGQRRLRGDPLAQTFWASLGEVEAVQGCFLSKIDLFFIT